VFKRTKNFTRSDAATQQKHARQQLATSKLQLNAAELAVRIKELPSYVDTDHPAAQHLIRKIWALLFSTQQLIHQLTPPTAVHDKKNS
jgi:hypothetical protein